MTSAHCMMEVQSLQNPKFDYNAQNDGVALGTSAFSPLRSDIKPRYYRLIMHRTKQCD